MTHDDKQELIEIFDLKLDPIISKLKEHHETLYGNGHDGLDKEVDRLSQQAKAAERSQGFRMMLWIGAVLAGLGGLINLAVTVF